MSKRKKQGKREIILDLKQLQDMEKLKVKIKECMHETLDAINRTDLEFMQLSQTLKFDHQIIKSEPKESANKFEDFEQVNKTELNLDIVEYCGVKKEESDSD